jgi:hypothetical protein
MSFIYSPNHSKGYLRTFAIILSGQTLYFSFSGAGNRSFASRVLRIVGCPYKKELNP